MQNLENENLEIEKIRNFIRSEIEKNYSEVFCKNNRVTKGNTYNINEFVNLFNNQVISKFYEKINHEFDNGEIIYKEIININNVNVKYINKLNEFIWRNNNILFNLEKYLVCKNKNFYLSFKNIQFLDLIIDPYVNNNIKIYTIDKKFLNDYIEIDTLMNYRDFDNYISRFFIERERNV
jgi:hypothetical protein